MEAGPTEYTVVIHASKMTYAILIKMTEIIEDGKGVYEKIEDFFPNVLDYQGSVDQLNIYDLDKHCKTCISSSVVWTGKSQTKSNSMGDFTEPPPQVNLTKTDIEYLHKKSSAFLSFNPDYVFYDSPAFSESIQTWTSVCNLFIQFWNLRDKFFMLQQQFNDLEGTNKYLYKSPGQLVEFSECEIILPTGFLSSSFVEDGEDEPQKPWKANYDALKDSLGSWYDLIKTRSLRSILREIYK